MRNSWITTALAAALAIGSLAGPAASPVRAIVGSDGSGSPPSAFNGPYINDLTGATTFYLNGFGGSRAVIANIEAGVAWTRHETLNSGQVAQYFADPSITAKPNWANVGDSATNGWTDVHATWVGQVLVGQGSYTYQQGMAPQATLWSGAIATRWVNTGTGNFSFSFRTSGASMTTPYWAAMVGGVNGQGTADVINSSWGNSDGQDGEDYESVMLDNLIYTSGKIVCLSAGNAGPGANTVASPASGFNTIVVGATSSDTTGYNAVANFSSRSPSAVFDPSLNNGDGATVPNARARIDIVAPGDNLTLAAYGGPTGGAQFGFGTFAGNNLYYAQVAGTSFASPTVAGGAALVVDVGKALYPNNPKAIDSRVVKAVLLNSATKLSGWDNGQTVTNGVITTTQSLDYAQGAGQLNLKQAWTQYTAGTNDVPGLGGGFVAPVGWDYGQVADAGHNDYFIKNVIGTGSSLTITLTWFVHSQFNLAELSSGYGAMANLDLQVYKLNLHGNVLIAQSVSKYNTTEHLSLVLPTNGLFLIRVEGDGFNWNGLNGITDTSTDYGLAWNEVDAVPEPTSACVLLIASVRLLSRPRRIRKAARSGGNAKHESTRIPTNLHQYDPSYFS